MANSLSKSSGPSSVARKAPRSASADESGVLGAVTDMPEDPNFVAALARGLAVLHCFSDRRRQMSIAEVSARTGLARATARRNLYTLRALGYVKEDENRRFSLLPKVLTFGHAYLTATPLALLAQPVLDRLSEGIKESCSLAVLDGTEIIYLARSKSSRIMSPALNVGRRIPAHCTSIGRVLLGHLDNDSIAAYLDRAHLRAFTSQTTTSPQELRRIFEKARRAGYATADQQMEPQFRTVAVPVHNRDGDVVAGMNVIIEKGRLTVEQMTARFLEPLRRAAAELGANLVL